jgi:hypothetical protein
MDSLDKPRLWPRAVAGLCVAGMLLGFLAWQILTYRARANVIVGHWIFADDLGEVTAGRERWVIRNDGAVDFAYWTYSQPAPLDNGGTAPAHSWLPSANGRWALVGDHWEISAHSDWTPPRGTSLWQWICNRLGISPPGPTILRQSSRAELLPDGQLRVSLDGQDRLMIRVPDDFVCPERSLAKSEIEAWLGRGRALGN